MSDETTTSKEQMVKQAEENILSALGNTQNAQEVVDKLKATIGHLYVEWSNAFAQEHATWITKQLERAGAKCDVHHTPPISYGDNYPTEYHISIGDVAVMGPTFDMALADFIQKLLKQNEQQDKEMAVVQKELKGLRHYKKITEPIIAKME